MKLNPSFLCASSIALFASFSADAAIEGSLDPASVVEQWSNSSTYPKVIDINFSDESWPSTWQKETGRDCPEWADGGYVNAVLTTPANGDASDVSYPVLFHNCTFATKKSFNGRAGVTAAFARQYYIGDKCSGNSSSTYNNWTVKGHTHYLEDNITYDDEGKPNYGEAGFVQMCRNAAINGESMHGWMEIDHIPYVDIIQWSWSSTSWGRGIKCDYKIGDGEWKPLVWMGSERQKNGWTVFSDQGYFMENKIDAHDVSIRWRVWDGEIKDNPVQSDVFTQYADPMAERQAPRVHKIQIFGTEITASDAEYARENPIGDIGTPSDLGDYGFSGDTQKKPSPDTDAEIVTYTVGAADNADYSSIQSAIDAIPAYTRGIIYLHPGIYEENVYAGRKGEEPKFISIIGEDPATTIITSSTSRGGNNSGNSYLDCAALNIFVDRFYAEGITIRNTSGNVGQAEALYTAGDAHVFNNCVISGYQDTYKANVGSRGYFVNCVISGATDFIYDGGLEWFENCEIRCLKGGGYITAPAETAMPMTKLLYPELSADRFYPGLFFRNCRITSENGVANGAYTLGRPWKDTCGAMFIRCILGNHISRAGWSSWSGTENNASLYEYKNMTEDGTFTDISGRASFSHQATDNEVEAYMNPEFMFGKLSDIEFDYSSILRGSATPRNFDITDNGIFWDADENAAAFIIYKNGKFCGISAKPEFTEGIEPGASYAVRSVSRHGVMSSPVNASEARSLLAFPSAEGFGKYTSGGRGGRVVTVTSLADDNSEGTLRWAFEQHKGEPITIVFAVSGNIQLNRELRVSRSDWTLAGQTAPGDGILISRNKVNFGGSSNFIVRNMRFRIGQKSISGDILAENACGAENCSDFIFDHCAFGWSVEENMNTADAHFLTVQHSIVHEGLYNAGHSKGARGYGCQWGGSPATYHHNLLAHNNSRSPRFNGARGEDYVVFMEYVNNVNYNYGSRGGCYGGENTAAITSYNGFNSAHECNFINNYYKPGPNSSKTELWFVNSSGAREGATSWAPAKWWVDGNIGEGFAKATADNWKAMNTELYTLDQIRASERIVPATPYYKWTLAGPVGTYVPERYMLSGYMSGEEAYNYVVEHAGTVNRDKVEQRVAEEARTGKATYGGSLGRTRGIIDKETDAEGFYEYSTDYIVPADTDGDGMPDEWEKSVGLDINATDNNRINSDGYTALEVYLASLMGESMSTDFLMSGIENAVVSAKISYDPSTSILTVSPDAIGTTLSVYALDGRMIYNRVVTSLESRLPLPSGINLLHLHGRNIAPRMLKISR